MRSKQTPPREAGATWVAWSLRSFVRGRLDPAGAQPEPRSRKWGHRVSSTSLLHRDTYQKITPEWRCSHNRVITSPTNISPLVSNKDPSSQLCGASAEITGQGGMCNWLSSHWNQAAQWARAVSSHSTEIVFCLMSATCGNERGMEKTRKRTSLPVSFGPSDQAAGLRALSEQPAGIERASISRFWGKKAPGAEEKQEEIKRGRVRRESKSSTLMKSTYI